MYRVCDCFIRRNIRSIDHGTSKSTLHIQNNQPYYVGAVKVYVTAEEIPKTSLRPTKGLQPSEVDCTLSDFIKKIKLRKKFMDLSDRRLRDRIQLASHFHVPNVNVASTCADWHVGNPMNVFITFAVLVWHLHVVCYRCHLSKLNLTTKGFPPCNPQLILLS